MVGAQPPQTVSPGGLEGRGELAGRRP